MELVGNHLTFELGDRFASGGFAHVHRGIRKDTGTPVSDQGSR